LGQIGEFSFVLGSAAAAAGAITHERYVALIAAVAISIAVSTVVVRLVGPRRARIDAVPPATAG
jgi:Kef-type K+ transport system membrane component KefB